MLTSPRLAEWLAARPEVEHGANPERRDSREVGALDPMDTVGPVHA